MSAPDLASIPTPALLLDLDVVERNVESMAARCRTLGVELRPHAKTHKCREVADLQRRAGAVGLTVATLREARTFVEAGWDDLTWAFPFVPGRVGAARELAEKATLRLTVDGEPSLAELEASGFPFHVWLEIDTGQRRSGVDARAPATLELARRLASSSKLLFDGILTHAGHSYHAESRRALRRVAEAERRTMSELAERLRHEGIPVRGVSIGSTPTLSVAESLEGVTEVRPGNYVFHDFTQATLGSCSFEDVGVSVLATVVSSQPGAGYSVVDAGALALSKDPGPAGISPPTFGEIAGPDRRPRGDLRLVSLSQEHGVLSQALPVGSRVRILPNHSCLTVACHDRYVVVRGDRIVDEWAIDRRR